VANRETKLNIVIDAQNKATSGLRSASRELDTMNRSTDKLAGTFSVLKAATAAAAAAIGFAGINVIKAGARFEQTQIAFETMLGSAEQAKKTLADLSQFASTTPFELEQLEESSKRLLAYGTAADDLLPTLKMLGDITAGVGMEKLPQLTLAFGQVQAATKLTGAELRQFSEAGVPLLGTLAEQLGKTEAEIIDMVSEGTIGFDQMKAALGSLTGEGGKFQDLMAKQATSLGGLWSNLKDQISLTARVLGTELLPYVKPVVENMIALATQIRNVVENLGSFNLSISGTSDLMLILQGYWIKIVETFNTHLRPALEYLYYIFKENEEEIKLVLGTLGKFIAFIAAETVIGAIKALALAIRLIADAFNVLINIMATVIEWSDKVIKKFEKMIALAKELGGNALSKIGGILPGRAEGGPVTGGSAYMVGEKGPEMFIPRTSGSIVPNGKLAGSSGITINVTGNTFLDQDTAEHIGDLVMRRLRLSSAM
jgi:tape measure domain-containing protein